MKLNLLWHIVLLLSPLICFPQDSIQKSSFSFSCIADTYYQYDFNNPANNERPSFLYNYKINNKPTINLALIKTSWQKKRLHINLGLMAGSYAMYNLASEPSLAKHIYEADMAYDLTNKLTISAGIFPSHIGFESAISKDNWNTSRSILAENSPYYETGVKLNYHTNNKWLYSLLILNGWQRIKGTNKSKAIGTQVQFMPDNEWLFNSSTFIGDEKQFTKKQMRLFHNLYISYIKNKWSFAFLFDAGIEKKYSEAEYASWFGTALLIRYSFNKFLKTAARIEYYNDKKSVLIAPQNAMGFATTGNALNIDFTISKNFLIRKELRFLHSAERIFENSKRFAKTNLSALISVVFYFEKNS